MGVLIHGIEPLAASSNHGAFMSLAFAATAGSWNSKPVHAINFSIKISRREALTISMISPTMGLVKLWTMNWAASWRRWWFSESWLWPLSSAGVGKSSGRVSHWPTEAAKLVAFLHRARARICGPPLKRRTEAEEEEEEEAWGRRNERQRKSSCSPKHGP